MPRKRNSGRSKRQSNTPKNSAAWERRNAKAQALGYRNYYDYRIHLYGKMPANQEAPRGEPRQRLRGHRGRVDFLHSLGPGCLISLVSHISSIERRPNGNYARIDKLVIYPDGDQRLFTLRNLSREQLIATIGDEEATGATFSPAPSLDQRRLVNQSENDAGYGGTNRH